MQPNLTELFTFIEEHISESYQKVRCFHPYKDRLVLCIELVQLCEGLTFLVYVVLLRTKEILKVRIWRFHKIPKYRAMLQYKVHLNLSDTSKLTWFWT